MTQCGELSSWLPAAAGRSIDLPCRVASVVRGELNIDSCQLYRLARAPHRRLAAKFLQFLHRRATAYLERCPDRTGGDAIYANPFRRKLLRQRLHVTHRRGLRLRVVIEFR